MKNTNHIISILLLIFITLPITTIDHESLKLSSAGKRIKLQNNLLQIQKAMAVTTLDPATMNLGTPAGRADFIRFLYFLVVGPTADYSIPNGPTGGLVGIVQQVMGSEGFGGALYQMGYTSCDSIPATGSQEINENTDVYNISFSTPSKTIPAHYGSYGGSSFTKSVSIALNSVNMVKVEFNCEAGGLSSGYIRMNVPDENRNLELYYLRDKTNTKGYLDFYMTYSGAAYDEKAAVQFSTTDDINYNLFLFRSQDNISGNDEAAGFGLNGSSSTGLVKVHYVFDNNDNVLDNSTAIGSASSECISLVTNDSSTGCGSISTPTNVTLGAAYSWTIQSLIGLSLNSL